MGMEAGEPQKNWVETWQILGNKADSANSIDELYDLFSQTGFQTEYVVDGKVIEPSTTEEKLGSLNNLLKTHPDPNSPADMALSEAQTAIARKIEELKQ